MFTVECFFCPDRITSNSGLTGPNNTIYIYIYIYIDIYIYISALLGHRMQSRRPARRDGCSAT